MPASAHPLLPDEPRATLLPMPAPTWTASYSKSSPLRRPLTAAGDIPPSPASSSASQKFEVKRLLSRPADPMPSPRPLTTFDTSTSSPLAGPSSTSSPSGATVKRSNSATRFLKRGPSKGKLESSAPEPLSTPPRAVAAAAVAPLTPHAPPSTLSPSTSTPALTPASAYALAYARRTNMTTQPAGAAAPRHPFEAVGTGRIVALGDPTDESLTFPALSLAGFGAEREKEKEKDKCSGGLSRKVSARFKSRRKATGVLSDAEAEDWSREKERVGMRAAGMMRLGRSATVSRNRMSRHLSIEDFTTVLGRGTKFEIERGRQEDNARPHEELLTETPRPRNDSTSHHSTSHHSHTFTRKEEPRPKEKAKENRPSRSASSPAQPPPDSRLTGAASPESKSSSSGGKIWRLVKKMSTGTLKEKRSSQPEKIPPVPRLPSTLPSSRRSSVNDYGEEIRPEYSQFRTNSHPPSQHSSRPNTIHQPSTEHPAHRATANPARPSMSHTNDSSVLSTSPPTSFGRTGSPRTSMSSYVDLGDEVPPPLPTVGVGKHIVAPGELNQMFVAGPGVSPSPSTKRSRKPRDKLALAPLPTSPSASMTSDLATNKLKPKPNVLRRQARLDGERSPRSASMGMPSPSPRSTAAMEPVIETPRPRSNSMGTVFTFRELGSGKKTPLSEQEKADKFERLLEASDKAGGTLHARAQDRLLSETIRMSAGTFDGASILGL